VCDEDTVIVDDTNPLELASFLVEKDVDVFIGGVKERPSPTNWASGLRPHTTSGKVALAALRGALAFAREVRATATSPILESHAAPDASRTATPMGDKPLS